MINLMFTCFLMFLMFSVMDDELECTGCQVGVVSLYRGHVVPCFVEIWLPKLLTWHSTLTYGSQYL